MTLSSILFIIHITPTNSKEQFIAQMVFGRALLLEHSDYVILPEERLNKIYEELNRHHVVKVEELAQLYGTSSMTIRRDLAELERRGLAVRSRGGAVLKTATLVDYNVHIRQGKNVAQKRAIAREAVKHVHTGDTLALDASTTVIELARQIVNLAELTVVTNNFLVANVLLSSAVTMYFVGGRLRREAFSATGAMAETAIKQFSFSKSFVSGNAVDLVAGLMDTNLDEMQIKRHMLSNSAQRYLLVDSSKLMHQAVLKVWPLEDFDVVITDDGISDKIQTRFEEVGIHLVIAATATDDQL